MKNKIFILLLFVSIGFSSCVKNTIENTMGITADKTSIMAGESITYNITGNVEHLSYYGGMKPGDTGTGVLDSAYVYTGRPVYGSGDSIPVTGVDLDLKEIAKTGELIQLYNRQGVFPVTFIASSYSNWGSETNQTITQFTIAVVDDRTAITDSKLKHGNISGFTNFESVIDVDKSKIIGYVPAVPDKYRKKLIVDLSFDSPDAVLTYENGVVFENGKKHDLTSGSLKFYVIAPNGDRLLWELEVQEPIPTP